MPLRERQFRQFESGSMYRRRLKRILDLCIGTLVLAALGPVLLAIAAALLLTAGRPVLFRQQRPGLYGKPFPMLKFRTMAELRDANGALLPDGQRLTRLGRFLRSTSLDELPELWNVLRGEMSLVGPRPLLLQYLKLYTAQQARRHEVKPGITGLAQVSGRNAISWSQKFDADVRYVDELSFWLDMKILCKTLVRVLIRDGINADSHCTMPLFTGPETEEKERHAKIA